MYELIRDVSSFIFCRNAPALPWLLFSFGSLISSASAGQISSTIQPEHLNVEALMPRGPNSTSLHAIWRDADHGPANVLYVFLRVHSYNKSYITFLKSLPGSRLPNSFAELKEAAKRCGGAVELRSVTPEEFRVIPVPIICHMVEGADGSGDFLLVYGRLRDRVLYFSGSSSTIHSMDWESFYRRWSGVALVNTALGASSYVDTAAYCAAGFIVGFGFLSAVGRVGRKHASQK